MITPQVQTYIREQLAAGVTQNVIKNELANNGWSAEDIAEAFSTAPIVPRDPSRKLIMGITAVVVLIGAGVALAMTSPGVPRQPQALEQQAPTSTGVTKCADSNCLAAAQSTCTPAILVVSGTQEADDIPFTTESLTETRTIEKSATSTQCVYTYTQEWKREVTEQDRTKAHAAGISDARIAEALRDQFGMPDDMKMICEGSTADLVAFLKPRASFSDPAPPRGDVKCFSEDHYSVGPYESSSPLGLTLQVNSITSNQAKVTFWNSHDRFPKGGETVTLTLRVPVTVNALGRQVELVDITPPKDGSSGDVTLKIEQPML